MPRTCRICAHPQVAEIESQLLTSTSYRTIANQYKVNFQSVGNHAKLHFAPVIREVQAERQATSKQTALTFLERLEKREREYDLLLESSFNHETKIKLLAGVIKLMTLEGRATGQFLPNKPTGAHVTNLAEQREIAINRILTDWKANGFTHLTRKDAEEQLDQYVLKSNSYTH